MHPGAARRSPPIAAPPSRAARAWTREDALVELLRGRLTIARADDRGVRLATSLGDRASATSTRRCSRSKPKASSCAGRSRRPAAGRQLEWCDRGLLARIHRYTLNRLRAEIEPVSPADFMRFLFAWQHVEPAQRG